MQRGRVNQGTLDRGLVLRLTEVAEDAEDQPGHSSLGP